MPDDLVDRPLLDRRLLAEEWESRLFQLDPAATALPDSAPREPSLDSAPVMIGFDDPEPDDPEPEPDRLDPRRAAADPGPPAPTQDQQGWAADLAAALGVHLLTLLVLLPWPISPLDPPKPIPVQLVVLKEPDPAQPPPQKAEAKPPPGRLASVDIGDPAAPQDQPKAKAEPPPEPPTEPKLAAPPPTPPPVPSSELVSALPKPVPASQAGLRPPEPAPELLPLSEPAPAPKQPVAARPAAHPRPPPRHGETPGPAASRNEYLAYCMTLVRQHYGLLPPSFLAGRRGVTVVNILVLGDGTIARVDVAQRSGHADIDSRVEQMIAAVRRFPPLPQWIQRPSIMMTYELVFPEGLLER